MNKLLLALLFIITSVSVLDAATLVVPQGELSFSLNSDWQLKGKEIGKYFCMYTYKRKTIKDTKGRPIISAIMIAVRGYDKGPDPVQYALYTRVSFRLKDMIAFYSWHDGKFNIRSGVLFHARKIDSHTGLHHTMLVFSAVYGRYTMLVVCNVPTDIFERVSPDFFKLFKTLRLKTKLPVPEIIEQQGKNHIAIRVRNGSYGMVKKMLK